MPLPDQLKAARITVDNVGTFIPTAIVALEGALASILGITPDVNVTAGLGLDNSGNLTRTLLMKAAAPVGLRFRDATGGAEFRLVNDGTYLTIDNNTGSEGTPVWANLWKLEIATGVVTFSVSPAGLVATSGDQAIDGVKTFSDFPVSPSSDPTTAYQFANKGYVDAVRQTSGILQNRRAQGVDGGTATSGSWLAVPFNTEYEDGGSIINASALPEFSLAAGTYRIEVICPFYSTDWSITRLYNVDDAAVQKNIGAKDMYSSSIFVAPGVNSSAVMVGTFTITDTKQFRIEYKVYTTQAVDGFGRPTNFAEEVYSQAVITRIG